MVYSQMSENVKCIIASEVKIAVVNENMNIENSEYKDYLYETLVTSDPFNKYYGIYHKSKIISLKVYLIISALLVPLSYVWSIVDRQMDFLRTAAELIIFMAFVIGFINIIISGFEKKKAMRYYIPIIKKNIDKLQYELKISTISPERRNYIAALHHLCSYIFTSDEYAFKHYKSR